jgi:hypothetical protein
MRFSVGTIASRREKWIKGMGNELNCKNLKVTLPDSAEESVIENLF